MCQLKLFRYIVRTSQYRFDARARIPSSGEWFHMAHVYLGPEGGVGGNIAYHNGVLVGSDRQRSDITDDPSTGNVVIGRKLLDEDTQYASVEIDEITFWDRILTVQEIREIYNMHK